MNRSFPHSYTVLHYLVAARRNRNLEQKNAKPKNVPFLNNVIALASRYTNHS